MLCINISREENRATLLLTQRNIFEILLNQIEIRLYLPFFD